MTLIRLDSGDYIETRFVEGISGDGFVGMTSGNAIKISQPDVDPILEAIFDKEFDEDFDNGKDTDCEYCHEPHKKLIEGHDWSSSDVEVYDGVLVLPRNSEGSSGRTDINFCPMCGRKF